MSQHVSTSQKSIEAAYYIRKLEVKDEDDFLQMCVDYCSEEPLYKRINYLADKKLPDDMKKSLLFTLNQNLSFGAFDENHKIIGISVNILYRTGRTVDTYFPLDPLQKMWQEYYKRFDFWSHVKGDLVIYNILSYIKKDWQRKGIFQQLLTIATEECKRVGASGLFVEVTSYFAQKSMEKLKMREIYRMKYSDLPVSHPPPPHTDVVSYFLDA